MKITIYELLGLVKDGKAPKKIKNEDEIWEEEYYSCKNGRILLGDLFFNYKIQIFINAEVEIIEEPKKIEKLELESGEIDDKEFLAKYITHNRYKINELIDEINDLKENN